MKQVYVITKHEHEDYHGTYIEVIMVTGCERFAKLMVKRYSRKYGSYNKEYWYDTYKLY